ncbi:MAG: glycosyltransferase family 4 protein [Planctomycetes bacterium]|nr:glycosyltransferase family 4 protein [Planctomycetota bacterium]MCB9916804.1 glycosyltransferase family 4 protein [Planctomycetota bacterium]
MLGWEFPPHISGGLGTACHGLTQSLAAQGVEVCFVVPRAYGDEDGRFVELVGCNGVALEQRAATTRDAVSPSPESTTVMATDRASIIEGIERCFELLSVDSLLGPYMTEAAYAQRYARVVSEGKAAHIAFEKEWNAVQALLAGQPAFREAGAQIDRIVRESSGGTLEFTGKYGPDLMVEVARYAVAVGEIARTRSFDVVHAHDWMTYAAGLVASAIRGKPLVVHMHASEFDRSGENVNPRIHELEHVGLHGARRVVCVSNYTAEIMRTRYSVPPEKLRVVHNGVDHASVTPSVEAPPRTIREPIVLFLGRVTFQKGPDYFLEAAAKVVREEPRVKFVMAGSGDMLPAMIERCARLGLARNMHFTGFLRGDDVKRMYAMADCYVMPSVSEPFGISPLEAMANDVPVIVSKQSGVSEVLRHALKVDFWDVDALADKILAVIRHNGLGRALAEEGREEVRGLAWKRPATLVKEVYAEVAS